MNRTRNGHRYSELHVAMVCHAQNTELTRVHELMRGPDPDSAPTTGPFMHLHPDLQAAAINGVIQVRAGIVHPPDLHNEWVRFLYGRGWAEGPRDPAAKTHPNLILSDHLDPLDQDKDGCFISTVMRLTLDY